MDEAEDPGMEDLDQRIEAQRQRVRGTIDALDTAHRAMNRESAALHLLLQERRSLRAADNRTH